MGSFDEFAQPVIDDLNSRLAETTTLLARERDAFGQRETELMKELAEAKVEIAKLKEDACAYHFCEIKALRFEIERLQKHLRDANRGAEKNMHMTKLSIAENAALQARLDIFINIAWRAKDLETDPATHKFITDTLASLSAAPGAKCTCENIHFYNLKCTCYCHDSAKPADGGEAKS